MVERQRARRLEVAQLQQRRVGCRRRLEPLAYARQLVHDDGACFAKRFQRGHAAHERRHLLEVQHDVVPAAQVAVGLPGLEGQHVRVDAPVRRLHPHPRRQLQTLAKHHLRDVGQHLRGREGLAEVIHRVVQVDQDERQRPREDRLRAPQGQRRDRAPGEEVAERAERREDAHLGVGQQQLQKVHEHGVAVVGEQEPLEAAAPADQQRQVVARRVLAAVHLAEKQGGQLRVHPAAAVGVFRNPLLQVVDHLQTEDEVQQLVDVARDAHGGPLGVEVRAVVGRAAVADQAVQQHPVAPRQVVDEGQQQAQGEGVRRRNLHAPQQRVQSVNDAPKQRAVYRKFLGRAVQALGSTQRLADGRVRARPAQHKQSHVDILF
ncbi:uncharacterized protein BcabD6B2_34500 [Babesia caballi]|uniref:Uncharacterized protein n=1 Tax=Babesia caballi TaxID=5871 RepID=A0AAV4LVX2_BABCB|nr:hypothetical protein BcabD6B2_34500 [Babesia caballi]